MFDYVKRMIASIVGRNNHEVNKEPRIIKASEHGIDPKLVSFAAVRTCSILQQRGYKAYVVGGAVRDLLLGVKPKDFDVATDATPEQVKRAQRRAFIIGRRFRLVHVVFGNEIVECSTFRALDASGVRKDASGRVISDNIFGEMWEDAARRDFTINALYYDPSTGDIYDYHGGYEDIRRKTLRMIGYPQARYREDPVRMMRAVRISAKLGFKIEKSADRAIAEIRARGRLPILAGGTGLYLRALLYGLDDLPADRELRRELDEAYDSDRGEEALKQRMAKLDPAGLARWENCRRRLIRALEVRLLTGKSILELQNNPFDELRYPVRAWRLDPPAEELKERIRIRARKMLDSGWIEEAAAAVKAGLLETPTAHQAIGYRLIAEHLAGKLDLETLHERISTVTWQFARRQRTWFRHQHPEAEVYEPGAQIVP